MVDAHDHHGRMRPLEGLIDPADALRRMLAAARPVTTTETIAIEGAAGRVLARAVQASADVPAFDRSAMDGYAVRAQDAVAGAALIRAGVVHAGHAEPPALTPGQAVQVATGSLLPEHTDAVVMVERTKFENNKVVVQRAVAHGENVSRKGADMQAGETVLRSGDPLTPPRVAVAIAAGASVVEVYRRPRVAVVATGSELRPAASPLRKGEIHDSNSPALAALFQSHGCDVTRVPSVPDDPAALRDVLSSLRDHDVVVLSGGSSAGEKDVVRDAVAANGSIEFHGVKVKPGKPLLFGRLNAAVVVGLPGYPVSCLCDAYLFVVPMLRRMARLPSVEPQRHTARLSTRVQGVPGRLWFLPVAYRDGEAVPTYKESGATTSLSYANGYIEVPADSPPLEPGTTVQVTLF